jgi:hypothetical protein
VRKDPVRYRLLTGLLLASCLAGCTPPFYRHTERRLACPCPPAQAADAARQAALARNGTPVFSTPTRLHVIQSNPDRLTVTKLTVAIVPTEATTTEVRVRTETPADARTYGEQSAEAFVAGFATAAKGTP